MVHFNIGSVFGSRRESLRMASGLTVAEMLERAGYLESAWPCLGVWIEGTALDAEWWRWAKPKSGTVVNVAVMPAGGNATQRKEILRTLVYIAGMAAGYATGETGFVMLGGILGGFAANLIPVPQMPIEEQSYAITAVRNQARKYEPVPRVYGSHRVFPPLAAMPTTEVAGQDHYLTALFCPGYKPLRLRQYKIGNQEIDRRAGVQIETNTGQDSRNAWMRLVPYDTYEEILDKPLEYCPDWTDGREIRNAPDPRVVSFRTQKSVSWIGVDFMFPEGLGWKNGEEWAGYRVDVQIRFRPAGATGETWVNAIPTWAEGMFRELTTFTDDEIFVFFEDLNARLDVIIASLEAIDETLRTMSDELGEWIRRVSRDVFDLINDSLKKAGGSLSPAKIATMGGLVTRVTRLLELVDGAIGVVEGVLTPLTAFNDLLSGVIAILNLIDSFLRVEEYVRLGYGPSLAQLPEMQRAIIYMQGMQDLFGPPPEGAFTLINKGVHQGVLRTNATWPVLPGRYDVQIRRVSESGAVSAVNNQWWDLFQLFDDDTTMADAIKDKCRVWIVRSVRDWPPVSQRARDRFAMVAMKVKASELLNGSLDQFNCMAEMPLPFYDDGAWQTAAFYDGAVNVFQNPAWIFCDMLRGNGIQSPVSDTQIDLVRIQEWATWCNENQFFFNAVYDRRVTLQRALEDVCRAGKATPMIRDGKFSVVMDREQTTPVAVITPRNSADFRATKSFELRPQALRVRYMNASEGYQQDELLVYDDGYGEEGILQDYEALFSGGVNEIEVPFALDAVSSVYDLVALEEAEFTVRNEGAKTYLARADTADWAEGVRRWRVTGVYTPALAERIEDIEFFGVTTATQAYKLARYVIACAKLRPEVFQLRMDYENLVFERGDLVHVQHDVTLWGLGSGRVTALVLDGADVVGVEIDEQAVFEAGKEYQFRIRTVENAFITGDLTTEAGAGYELTFSAVPATSPAVGDLVIWGEKDLVTTACIVKEIRPGGDLTAQITLVEAAPAVHYAETGPIPEFDSRITVPPGADDPDPAPPSVVRVRTDEGALTRTPSGSLVSRIMLSVEVPASADLVEVQYRRLSTSLNEAAIWQSIGVLGGTPVFEHPMPWLAMPVFQTPLSEVSASPVDDRHYYDVRLRSLTSIGRASEWELVPSIYVIGKSTRPPDVRTVRISEGQLYWDYPDPPIDFKGFLVRHIHGEGGTWETATPSHSGVLSASRFEIPNEGGGPRVFLIKAVDVAGNESLNAARVVVDLGEMPFDNIILFYLHQAEDWPGQRTGCEVNPSTLYLEGSQGTKTEFYRDAGLPFYRAGAKEFYTTDYPDFVYEWSTTPDDVDLPYLLSLIVSAAGENWRLEFRDDDDDFWPDDTERVIWPPDVRHVVWPAWTEWKAVGQKISAVEGVTYSFRIVAPASDVQTVVNSFILVKDVPDVIEHIEDFEVADSGEVRLPTMNTYRKIVTVQVSLQADGGHPNAQTVEVLDKDENGPSVAVYGGTHTRVSGIIDARVQGY